MSEAIRYREAGTLNRSRQHRATTTTITTIANSTSVIKSRSILRDITTILPLDSISDYDYCGSSDTTSGHESDQSTLPGSSSFSLYRTLSERGEVIWAAHCAGNGKCAKTGLGFKRLIGGLLGRTLKKLDHSTSNQHHQSYPEFNLKQKNSLRKRSIERLKSIKLIDLDPASQLSRRGSSGFFTSNEQQTTSEDTIKMATVRPISPHNQHTLDSAISLAKELASKNMGLDSGESSPKTPTSPDKKRFNFKLKQLTKSFSEASNNIRDIESTISDEAKQAYKSLVERGAYHSGCQNSPFSGHLNNSYQQHNHGSHTSHHGMALYGSEEFSPSFHNPTKFKHMSAFSVKKSFF